ncbi:Glutamyl-tRNA reductase [Candidatus Desulfarcum epimagneticum]|uniref:Glutamyl-tRNA reductase n=1 Tax=uncultured Desulfobacteraceae bacterium TaxID=218296 RepID=A0A484HIE4_9BACT|nr:Glutamyl-tRNA reductase [uncultured Desulfobacteraceae bacterium]
MLDIVLTGLNHQTARVDIRERLSFSGEEIPAALERLAGLEEASEAALISTCNRVEILMAARNADAAAAAAAEFISGFKGVDMSAFQDALYIKKEEEAVRHMFRVASSLDSMVIGEPQILGQIKSSYNAATRKKTSGVMLNRLLHRAFFVAKRVRTETGIGDHAVSISHAAVELARKIFGDLEGRRVLLIGAGEMAELAVERLIRDRVGKIQVANRTFERGVDLASTFGGEAARFEEILPCVERADIIISSTGSPEFVVQKSDIKGVMKARKNRPLFFIDIAVPRDIDPDINRLHNVYVYDIDDLKGVVDDNIEDRKAEAEKGERIIDEAVIRFMRWRESLDAAPTIVAIRNKMSAIAEAELQKTFRSLSNLSEHDRNAIRKMTESLANKFLHDPTLYLKKNHGCRRKKAMSTRLDMARKLFNLDSPGGEDPGRP